MGGDDICSIILRTLRTYVHNESWLIYKSNKPKKNPPKKKIHVLKRDFLGTLQGGSLLSSNEEGCHK